MAVRTNIESEYMAPYRKNAYGYSSRIAMAVSAPPRGNLRQTQCANSTAAPAPNSTPSSEPAIW